MAFHNVVFPLKFRPGTELGPSFLTTIQETAGGTRYVNAQRVKPRRIFAVIPGNMNVAEVVELTHFYNARRGAMHSFKVLDPLDCSTHSDGQSTPTTSDGLVNLGAGDGTTVTYQLRKLYESGGYSTEWPILLPDPSTVIVQVNGVTQTVTTDYTINSLTGAITFNSPPTATHSVDAGGKFWVPVAFGADIDRQLGFQGSRALATIQAIPMLETLNPVPVIDIGFGGGATDWSASGMSANVTFDVANGSTQVWKNDSGGGLRVILPAKASIDLGRELRVKLNATSGNGLTIRDVDTTTDLYTLSAGETGHCVMTLNSSGSREWVVVS